MVKIGFYVPPDYLEPVKTAVFDAGAGRIGNYQHCSWQSLGEGQFRPNDQSSPFIGEKGTLESLPEYRVEVVCDDQFVRSAIDALRGAHPYEEPAYDVCALLEY